ncbi:MAG: DMT family transporter [Rhizobiales bacterium]|nr:DMT family transporter [Hyphomicrobiales bacterium]
MAPDSRMDPSFTTPAPVAPLRMPRRSRLDRYSRLIGLAKIVLPGTGLAILAVALLWQDIVPESITRRHRAVRMTPAMCFGTMISAAVSATLVQGFAVTSQDMAWLFAFGAINLGMGLAMFATGARLVPSALAALVGTLEPVLGPIWVWLMHSEVPSKLTLVGGSIVFAALLIHLLIDFTRQRYQ